MSNDAPYRHAPLVLTLLELRHPPATLTGAQLSNIKDGLSAVTPVQRVETPAVFMFDVTGNSPAMAQQPAMNLYRFTSRDARTSVLFRPDAITLETLSYSGWTGFKSLTETVLSVRQDIAPVDGVERIGLRYIDEIRIPDDASPDWSNWIAPNLLAPSFLGLDATPQQQQCTVQYQLSRPDQTLTLRYGAVVAPSAAPSSFSQRAPQVTPPAAPHFLIDTDAAWTLGDSQPLDEVNIKRILEQADELHSPSKAVFEAFIQDQLREVFNRA